MISREEYLIKLNNKGKIQQVKLQLEYNEISKVYYIHRYTGQYKCKEITQPLITISEGKAGRSIEDQSGLQFVSQLKGYLDSGYKKLSSLTIKKISELTEDELKSLLGLSFNTDSNGIPKPMLAKSSVDLATNVFEKEHYCSRKIDGVRCLMYYKNNEIHTASRGGKDYDVVTEHIRSNDTLKQIFIDNPTLILDGELYHHGWPLQKISGTCRLQERNTDCDQIEYWIYDYVDNKPFKERYEFLMTLKELFLNTSKIKILDHYKLSGWLVVKKWHDKFVQEGFEGLCARNPEKEYGIGKRSGTYLIKLKDYQDAEFEITGIKEGLRPEDMCFTLKTDKGKEFAAKPACDTQTRLDYLANKDKYIGKMATCKFFYYSSDGVPLQPVFKYIRPEDE